MPVRKSLAAEQGKGKEMKNNMKKAVLVIGLSIGLVNCGEDRQAPKKVKYQQFTLQKIDIEPGVNFVEPGNDDFVGTVAPDLEPIHGNVRQFKISGRRVRLDSVHVLATNQSIEKGQAFQVAQRYDLSPARDFMPEREDIIIEEVTAVAIAEDSSPESPEWRGEFPKPEEVGPSIVKDDEFWAAAGQIQGIYSLRNYAETRSCEDVDSGRPETNLGSFLLVQRVKKPSASNSVVVIGCETKDDCYRMSGALDAGKPLDLGFSLELTSLNTHGIFEGFKIESYYRQEDGACTAQSLLETKVSVIEGNLTLKQSVTDLTKKSPMDCHDLESIQSLDSSASRCSSLISIDAQVTESI